MTTLKNSTTSTQKLSFSGRCSSFLRFIYSTVLPRKKTIRITEAAYPRIFEAMIEILYDNGGVDQNNPEPVEFVVQQPSLYELVDVEMQLRRMSREDLLDFCIGEESEQDALVKKHKAEDAHAFLNNWFNGDI